MIKLSFIVPVYNVKAYLRKCVDSLLHQDYDDYEIILVDDGSTDGSGELADQLTAEINSCSCGCRCRTLHQANRGLSGARNAGIELASGEYICFVDSDDYWEENVLGGLMAQIERENLGVLRFTYQNVRLNNDGYEVFQPYKHPHYVDHQTDIVDGLQFLNNRLGYQCYAWQFIVKTEIVKEERFTEGINYEDVEWTPRMLLLVDKVNSSDKIVYNYIHRANSITTTQNYGKIVQNNVDKFRVIQNLYRMQCSNPEAVWLDSMITELKLGLLNNVIIYVPKDYGYYVCACKKINASNRVVGDEWRTVQNTKRMQAFLLHISPILFRWFIKIKVRL